MRRTPLPIRSVAALAVVLTLVASACSDAGSGEPAAPVGEGGDAVGGTVESTGPPAVCPETYGEVPVGPPDGVADAQARIEPVGGHPLLAELVLEVDVPAVPVVRLRGPEGDRPTPAGEDPATAHTVLLAGMRAETEYTVDVALLDSDCSVIGVVEGLTLTTGALPPGLPDLVSTASAPDAMNAGVTLFNLIDIRDDLGVEAGTGDSSEPPPRGWLVMVDDEGEIVWFHHQNHSIGDARMLDDGTILFEFNDTAARRIDLRGTVLDEWAGTLITGRLALDELGRRVVGDDPTIVAADSMHHEQYRLPDGTHATLSTEVRVVDGFTEPVCNEDPATFDGSYRLIADIVVLFDPATGAVIDEFPLFDVLGIDPRDDPVASNLCGIPFDWVFPNWLYAGGDAEVRDWTHANAVEVDEAANTLLVSVRHLDAIVGLRWKDDADGPAGELLWHSGPLGDLELVSGDWHRHQHAPEVQDDGTLLVYDNGNRRPGAGTPGSPFFSRAVQYRIDPVAGTVEQLWEYRAERDGEPLFAPFVGDVDRLDNGNVLIANGGLNSDEGDRVSAQLVEVVPTPPAGGEVVWGLEVRGGAGWVVYRAERLASVHG